MDVAMPSAGGISRPTEGGKAHGWEMIVQTIPFPRARRADPMTSHMAAASARPAQLTHIDAIRSALVRHGAGTIEDIAHWTALSPVQVARRLPDMQKVGLAAPNGEHGLSVCGRLERKWVAA